MRGTGTAVRTLTVVRAALGVCGVALGAVGVWQLVALTGPETPRRVAVWLAGAAVVHDALLAPLVLAVGWLVRRLPAAVGAAVAGAAGAAALAAVRRRSVAVSLAVLTAVTVAAMLAGTLSVARTLVLNDPDDPDDDVFTQEVRWDRGDHPTFYGPEGWGDAFCAAVTG